MTDAIPVILYQGVSGFEALGALAALHAAGRAGELVAADAMVTSREGARLVPDRLGYATLEAAPAVILPGGDVRKALVDAALAKALRARRGRFVLASGDAVRVLAAAGLTEDRRIALLPGDAPIPGAEGVASRLVADGRLLTSFAGDALIDLVLHHVGHEADVETAKRAAAALGREHNTFAYGRRDPQTT